MTYLQNDLEENGLLNQRDLCNEKCSPQKGLENMVSCTMHVATVTVEDRDRG